MSFNIFEGVSTEGGMENTKEFKPLNEGTYVVKFVESTRKEWDSIPQISFRFAVTHLQNGSGFTEIQKVAGRENVLLFTGFRIFQPVTKNNTEDGFNHSEKPLRALLMATKALTAYDNDEEVQELLQIPVAPTHHLQSNGVTNARDIVDSYCVLFNNILVDTACKADVTKWTSPNNGKTYNNIRWYNPLEEYEADLLSNGRSTTPSSQEVATANFKPSEPSESELTDDDIPF
tara:strand:- start:387 stop:1082 length:696 start_codon:yes stop_codon:yes gene_type:complete